MTSPQAHIKTTKHSKLGLTPSPERLYAQQDTINAAESLMNVFGIDVNNAELEKVVGISQISAEELLIYFSNFFSDHFDGMSLETKSYFKISHLACI